MKRVLAATLFLYLVVPAARAGCDDARKRIESTIAAGTICPLLQQFSINLKAPVYFVVIDHRAAGSMEAYRWTNAQSWTCAAPASAAPPTLETAEMPRGDDGVFQLALSRSGRAIVVLAHTNPPLYTLTKTTTFAAIPGVDDLAKIVNAVGGFVAAGQARPLSVRLTSADDFTNLKSALGDAVNVATAVNRDRDFAVRYLQYSEEGATPPAKPKPYPSQGAGVSDVGIRFGALREKRNTFAGGAFASEYACKEVNDLAKRARTALDTPATAENEIAKIQIAARLTACSAAVQKLNDTLNSPRRDAGVPTVGGRDNIASLGAGRTPANPPDDRKRKLDDYIATSDGAIAILRAADDLLATELGTLQIAAAVERLTPEANPFGDPCLYSDGLIFAETPDQVAFDKIGTVKVTIAEASPLGATYHRRAAATGDRSFRIANPVASRISIGVGGIYTPLREPTYAAVTDPFNADQKVIAKTAEKKRAGALALLGTYRWGRATDALRPGVQLGTGFGSDPQIFGGFSLDIGDILRFGVGVTGQQVKGLAGGQTPLSYGANGQPLAGATVVKSSDDIRTKQRFVGAPYLSLTVSLDSLSLFKRP